MSGPKGIAYSVESSAERERREVGAARARCTRLRDALSSAEHEASILGAEHEPSAPGRDAPPIADLRSLGIYERGLRDALDRADAVLAQARAQVWLRQVAAGADVRKAGGIRISATTGREADTAAVSVVPRALGDRRRQDSPGAREDAASSERVKLKASALRVLEQLATVTDEDVRGRLAGRARQALKLAGTADTHQARAALSMLQADTSRCIREQRAHDRLREAARELELLLAGVSGPDVELLRQRIAVVADERTLAMLELGVNEALEADRVARDRAYVVEQTAAALRGLGYDIDESFEVLATAGEPALATRSDLGSHALQVRLPLSGAIVLTNVVAFGATTVRSDVAAEEATCADVASLREAWLAKGVRTTLTHHRQPGSVPVERAEGDRRALRSRSRRQQPKVQRQPGSS